MKTTDKSETELILINISGQDRPGVTSALTEILGKYDASILDIGQADIHHTLALGILFKTESHKSGDIMKELLFKAAEKNDAIALRIFNYTGKVLGRACADFATFNSPEAFVFFGGLTKAGEYLMKPLREAYDEHVLYTMKGKAKLLVSALNGSEAAVLGASALGWE